MIKIIPRGYTNVFNLEIYEWSVKEQKMILTGNHEFCCHSDGTFHSKDLLSVNQKNTQEKKVNGK